MVSEIVTIGGSGAIKAGAVTMNQLAKGVVKEGVETALYTEAGNLANMAGIDPKVIAGASVVFAGGSGNLNKIDDGVVLGSKGTSGGKYSAFGEMSEIDGLKYNQYWDDVAKGLDTNTRVKLNQWQYRPDADLYNKYQGVYDNPKYFVQETGNAIYPGMNGNIHVDGFTNGIYENGILQPDTIIDRYGSNGTGKFFSPDGTPYEERALPPFMQTQPYTRYEIIQPMEVQQGEIAPWFGQIGGGTQFLSEYSVDELKDLGIIKVLEMGE